MTYCPFYGKDISRILEAIEKEKETWQPTTIPYSPYYPYPYGYPYTIPYYPFYPYTVTPSPYDNGTAWDGSDVPHITTS